MKYKPLVCMDSKEVEDFLLDNFDYNMYDRIKNDEPRESILLILEEIYKLKNKKEVTSE